MADEEEHDVDPLVGIDTGSRTHAGGHMTLITFTCPTCNHAEQQTINATVVAHRCPRKGGRLVQMAKTG